MGITVRTELGLSAYKNSESISLIDIHGNKYVLTRNELKQRIICGQIEPVDFQIDKAGRLVNRKVDYKQVYRTFNASTKGFYDLIVLNFFALAKSKQLTKEQKAKLKDSIIHRTSIQSDEINAVQNRILELNESNMNANDPIMKKVIELYGALAQI